VITKQAYLARAVGPTDILCADIIILLYIPNLRNYASTAVQNCHGLVLCCPVPICPDSSALVPKCLTDTLALVPKCLGSKVS